MKCFCCGNDTSDFGINDQFLNNPLQICKACKHIQLKTLPSPTDLFNYYNSEYSSKRAAYIGEPYYKIMKKRALSQYLFFMRNNLPITKGFDIGCGFGFLMDVFIENGIDVKGVEFDKYAASFCNAKNLVVDLIQDEKQIKNIIEPVQIITMSHVLEHLTNFDETIEIIRKNSDFVFIEVPAYNYKLKEQFYDQEGHIQFFNKESFLCFLINRFIGGGGHIIYYDEYGQNLNFFYKNNLNKLRSILYKFEKDYFFNKYKKKTKNGIWLRALVQTKSDFNI
jgi:hypothetical protein